MLTPQSLFDCGLPSAKDASYLSTNKFNNDEKEQIDILQTINSAIRKSILNNKHTAEIAFPSTHLDKIDNMIQISQLLEKIGYSVILNIITTPLYPNKAVPIYQINWEGG